MNGFRGLGFGAAVLAAVGFSITGTAAADPVVIPFQVNPAPFGNPNGSFDVPPIRCAVVLDQPGSATITGGNQGGWGCMLSSPIHWINLNTGATGYAQLSDGLNGIPPRATLHTGPGQIALVLTSISGGTTTPGLATFTVT